MHGLVCLARALSLSLARARRSWSRLSQLMQHENELLRNVGRHPNLVSHHGYYESPWQCAIMLDLVQGGDCQQLLQRQGALSEPLVQSMISELHSALRHLHARSVLHRDVKLENVLCDTRVRPPSVKLCDLGHAMSCHSMETDRHFYGTPGYAAPEVIRGPLWTFAADVWAMGVVMYALLCNALPFEEGDWKRPVDFSSRHWWKVRV